MGTRGRSLADFAAETPVKIGRICAVEQLCSSEIQEEIRNAANDPALPGAVVIRRWLEHDHGIVLTVSQIDHYMSKFRGARPD